VVPPRDVARPHPPTPFEVGDESDLRAVALAWHESKRWRPTNSDAASEAAVAVYRARHPEADRGFATDRALRLVHAARGRWGEWIHGASANGQVNDPPPSHPEDVDDAAGAA
jgi:hypothetical protein